MSLPASLTGKAGEVLELCLLHGVTLATAESCTGGLAAAALTAIPGSSRVVERGFVTYSNQAKHELLGVPDALMVRHGAVSAEVARAMALGALKHSHADLAVAVTGIAGPGGGTEGKPVGLVHLAVARGDCLVIRECRFGDIGRREVRLKAVEAAMEMLASLLQPS